MTSSKLHHRRKASKSSLVNKTQIQTSDRPPKKQTLSQNSKKSPKRPNRPGPAKESALVERLAHNLFPGTNTNIQINAAATPKITQPTKTPRFANNPRTYGSRTFAKLKSVYSL